MKKEYPEETGHEPDYLNYMIAFQFACAVRKELAPEAFKRNQEHNQNDLLDNGTIAKIQNIIYDLRE